MTHTLDLLDIRRRASGRLRLIRVLATVGLDSAIWIAALLGSILLRFEFHVAGILWARCSAMIGLAVGLNIIVGMATRLYLAVWRIASFEELLALTYNACMVTTALIIVDAAQRSYPIPMSAVIAAGATAVLACGAARAGWRIWWERTHRPSTQACRAVVYGLGEAGGQLVRSLLVTPDSPYLPVALLDDDPAKRRLRIRHLQVTGGIETLPEVARSFGASAVIMAIPSADAALVRRVSEVATQEDLLLRVLPSVHEMLDSTVRPESIRPVSIDDLLGRRVIDTDVESIAGYLRDKRVLITGAGGSIGSELCRHVARYEPEKLVMLDRDESALHAVQLSLHGRALLDTRDLVVCDIRDSQALKEVFQEHRPDVVFHAAALKHLPLLEMWPSEAIKTNIFGTQHVLEAAMSVGTSRFVNISTDKAANPSSILGYTKRLAERLTASAKQSDGTYLSVRFGNVLGSRGSVLTAFREQIAGGGPITVTHPEVTRFFMTVGEAVELVIQAGAVGTSGEVLILDMGQPVKIADVAERLIIESDQDIKIEYTGLRPGEKLHEELFGPNEIDARPQHPLISQTAVPPLDIWSLEALEDVNTPTAAHERLRALCSYRTTSAIS